MATAEEQVLTASLTLLGVFVGFVMTYIWDQRKEAAREARERQRIVVAVWWELSNIAVWCRGLTKALESGQAKGGFLLQPPKNQAWTLAAWNWPLLRFRDEEAVLLFKVSALADYIVAEVRFRDMFSATNLAWPRHEEVMGTLNGYLLNKSKQYVAAYEKVNPMMARYLKREGLGPRRRGLRPVRMPVGALQAPGRDLGKREDDSGRAPADSAPSLALRPDGPPDLPPEVVMFTLDPKDGTAEIQPKEGEAMLVDIALGVYADGKGDTSWALECLKAAEPATVRRVYEEGRESYGATYGQPRLDDLRNRLRELGILSA